MGNEEKKVTLADVERLFEFGSHRSGSADRKIHERYLNDVVRDRMEPDALIFYGALLEPTDVRFVRPWVDAMQRLIDADPQIVVRIRLRHGRTFNDVSIESEYAVAGLRAFMRDVGTRLKVALPPEYSTNSHLEALVRRLDCSCT